MTDSVRKRFLNIDSREKLTYFLLAVSGFSFWFFIAVPFASHRESYVWLAWARRESLTNAFGLITATWRPLAQLTTWLGYLALDPQVFPTNPLRQTLLQCCVYLLFVLAWLVIYSAAPQRKVFSLVALVAGGVFFSSYIHLFHIYGVFYLPVLVILALMLKFHADGDLKRRETLVASFAIILVLWHPFATAIFLGFYFGRYLSRLTKAGLQEHLKTWIILIVGATATLAALFLSPRIQQTFNPLGFIATFQTNEVNWIASIVALLLAVITALSMDLDPKWKFLLSAIILIMGAGFWTAHIPLVLLWILVALYKLIYLRNWELAVPLVVATGLPYGAGIGAPVYGLYALVLAVFVTPLGWSSAEEKLRFLDYRYATAFMTALLLIVAGMRAGASVPLVSQLAKPLLVERERTFQLEHALSWLASSDYCTYGLAFAAPSGDPVDSIEEALTRRYRPPATLDEAAYYWDNNLRCQRGESKPDQLVTITFGGQELKNAGKIFDLPSSNAGAATIWIGQ
jgi:hypothetical protein